MRDNLGKKPSTIIRRALDDLKAVEKNPKYCVDMGAWHEPRYDDRAIGPEPVCAVCLAGAVIANRLHADPNDDLSPGMIGMISRSQDLANKLDALDDFRMGNVHTALDTMGKLTPRALIEVPDDVTVPPYNVNRAGFKRALRRIAAKLQSVGL